MALDDRQLHHRVYVEPLCEFGDDHVLGLERRQPKPAVYTRAGAGAGKHCPT